MAILLHIGWKKNSPRSNHLHYFHQSDSFYFPITSFYLYRYSLILQLSNVFAPFYPFISDTECLRNLMSLFPPIRTMPEAANEMSWDCSVAQWNCFSRLAKLFHHMVLCIKQLLQASCTLRGFDSGFSSSRQVVCSMTDTSILTIGLGVAERHIDISCLSVTVEMGKQVTPAANDKWWAQVQKGSFTLQAVFMWFMWALRSRAASVTGKIWMGKRGRWPGKSRVSCRQCCPCWHVCTSSHNFFELEFCLYTKKWMLSYW